MKPAVAVANNVWEVSPRLNTVSGHATQHYGVGFYIQRGGVGYVLDYVVIIEANITFMTFDGPDS